MSLSFCLAIIFGGFVLLARHYSLKRNRYTKNTRIDGKIVIVTGANSGIGKATAVELAKRGGRIYIACRDSTRAEKALKEIKSESGSDDVHFLRLDLASMESVRKFSQEFHALESRLDVLINNAGILACPKTISEDGFELQFATNFLGPFLLTNLLLDLLKSSKNGRIVNYSSNFYCVGRTRMKKLIDASWYNKFIAYGTSKLAVVLFTRELSRKLVGTSVTVNCLHPGHTKSQLTRHFGFCLCLGLKILEFIIYKDPSLTCQTAVRLSIDPELEGVTGKYFKNCEERDVLWFAKNEETENWLWDESKRVTGL